MAVRYERVVLELEDRFTGPLSRPVQATKAFEATLSDVDKTSKRAEQSQRKTADSVDRTGRAAARSSREIDRFSGRLRLVADLAATLGPALVTVAAVGVPAVSLLASQFGAAAIAGGTMLAAFQGFGTALEAVNKAALEPTSANLNEARVAMAAISPEARELVRQVQEMRPAFTGLRDAAAAGLFPGLTAALEDAEGAFDRIEGVLYRVGEASGALAEDFAEGLAGPRGQEFLTFVGNEVPGALTDLGHTVGNLAAGLGELWMAFAPLNRSASDWLLDASRGFDEWAQGVAETEGFQEFVAYVRENGPRVADALGSIGNAALQIAEAMAPLGGPALDALATFADIIAAIANSPVGPPLAAVAASMVLISRGLKGIQAVKASTIFGAMTTSADDATRSTSRLGRALGTTAGAAVGLEILRAAIEALESSLDKTLPTTEELVGNLLDLSSGDAASLSGNFDDLGGSLERVSLASDGMTGKLTSIAGFADKYGGGGLLGLAFDSPAQKAEDARAEIEALDGALANIATTGGAKQARQAFEALAESQNLGAGQTELLLSMLPQYRDALAGIENQGRLTGDGIEDGFDRGVSAAQRFQTAIARLNRMLEGRANLRDYEAALDDFTKGLRQNGRTFDINTEKGRLNQENLDNIAATIGRVVEGMKRSDRQSALRQARQDIRDLRDAGKLSESQMRFLLDEINKLDKSSANPKINVTAPGAAGVIAGVNAALNGIQDETVYINVKRSPLAGAALGAGAKGSAYGENEVPGQRSPYGDKVWRAVAPGEGITTNRNGESDRNRDVIRMINAGQDVMRMMAAERVTVATVPVASPAGGGRLSESDVQRIADAVRVGAAAGIAGREQARDRGVRTAGRVSR